MTAGWLKPAETAGVSFVTKPGVVVDTRKIGAFTPWGSPGVTRATAAWLLRYESEHTRRGYRRAQVEFVTFLSAVGVDRVEDVRRAHVDAYARWLGERGLSVNSRYTRICAVSSWLGALVDEEVIGSNPAAGVRRPKREQSGSTVCPSTETVRAVLAELAVFRGPGVALAVELMAWYALRVSSVTEVIVNDVMRDSSGCVYLSVPVKGGRRVPLRMAAGDLGSRVWAHAQSRDKSEALFVTARGERVTDDVIRRALDTASRHVGLPAPVSAHQFRTWAINAALDAGMGIDDVAEFAMHADVRTTRRYDRNRGRRKDMVARAVAEVLAMPTTG